MYCARLDHFARFNADGSIGKCGHMIGAPGFASWSDMQQSQWLQDVKYSMAQDQWPTVCVRCQQTENNHGHSLRLHSLERHKILHHRRNDYLILAGVLDNVCNSACQSCNANLSTKIGSLSGKNYKSIDNQILFDRIPMDQVLEIDLNGGEPTASPSYQLLIKNLPDNVKVLRVNTNGSRLLPHLKSVLDKGVHVIITLSLDGTDRVHDYVRWPIMWKNYCDTVDQYQELTKIFTNLTLQTWTTLHALNLADFENIRLYAERHDLKHDWAYLENPQPINVKFSNSFTRSFRSFAPTLIATEPDNEKEILNFIANQDRLRGINIRDYL